MKDLTNNV